MDKILITGINGFAGSHLADLLVGDDTIQVHGTIRRHTSGRDIKNLEHLLEENWIDLHECEMLSQAAVEEIINRVRPNFIFHLAAQSFVPASWQDPSGVVQNNVQTTLNLLEAVKHVKERSMRSGEQYDPVIHIAGSSEEYGLVLPGETPIQESNPLRPLSPYAVTKITCEMLGYQYARSYGLKTVITRAFNHEGARRGQDFVISNFAKQIAEQMGIGKRVVKVRVGNLEARRDFTHVRDTVNAYWMLALGVERGDIQPGEVFNIATGQAYTMADMLEQLGNIAGVEVLIEEDPERMRPSDVPILLGSAEKLQKATGWKPKKTISDILSDTLEYWKVNV